MKSLFCAAFVLAGWLATAVAATPGEDVLARLRAAGTMRLLVEQAYVYIPRSHYQKKEITGYQLPFAKVTRHLLEDAGVRVVELDSTGAGAAAFDATLAITARGRAIGRLYLDDTPGYLYAGAELIGDIVFSAPAVAPWRTEFRSQYGPPLTVQLNLGFDRPGGAPFPEAFRGPTSFTARIMEVIGQIYGAPPLIAALDRSDIAVRLHAVRVLGGVGGDGAVEALLAALTDPDPLLRKEAAWSLGRLRDPDAVSALTIALDDVDGDVRWFAGWALSKIGDIAIGETTPDARSGAAASTLD